MTLKEFLKELKKTPRDWRVKANGRIVRLSETSHTHEQCPIDALGGDYRAEFGALGLSEYWRSHIVTAADELGAPKTRARLLAACGIKEQ